MRYWLRVEWDSSPKPQRRRECISLINCLHRISTKITIGYLQSILGIQARAKALTNHLNVGMLRYQNIGLYTKAWFDFRNDVIIDNIKCPAKCPC